MPGLLATLAMTVATAATATAVGPAPIPPVPHPTRAPAVAAGNRHGEAWVRVPGTDSDHDGRDDRVHLAWHLPDGEGPFPVVLEPSPYNSGLRRAPNHDVDVEALHVPGPDPVPTYRRWLRSGGYAYVAADSWGPAAPRGVPRPGDPTRPRAWWRSCAGWPGTDTRRAPTAIGWRPTGPTSGSG